MECSSTTLKLQLASVLWTSNIAFEFIKVDMTPRDVARVFVNKPDTSMLTNQVLHVPALARHRLLAGTKPVNKMN